MALLSVKQVSLRFGGAPLLDGVELHIEGNERIALLGANGAGKSSLLRLIAGDLTPDSGEIACQAGVRVSAMPQQIPEHLCGPVIDIVSPGHQHDADATTALEADQIISRLNLSPTDIFENLSGGSKRRTLLARALLGSPDIVLLDEPTNHLDIDSITWLESFLPRFCKTILFITHDRAFLRRMATRIVELDRGRIVDWACDYDTFLKRKEEVLADEAKEWFRLDRKLEQEEAWLRRGIKARRTRNEGRVRALEALRAERALRREHSGTAQISIQEADRTGRLVVRADNISFSYDQTPLIRKCSIDILRGDKIGVIGPNGCGKTTLLRLLLEGENPQGLRPASGTVRLGANVQVAYSDQLRTINREDTVIETLADGREFITINNTRRHVLGYLGDFLFTPDRARQPVHSLSGGERNRLLLARLFAHPSNVLVLDEPTNDLDLETLTLLEEQVADYNGTVIIVSHDRDFLNAVADRTLVFEHYDSSVSNSPWLTPAEGWFVNEYAGGYNDWLSQRRTPPPPPTATKATTTSRPAPNRPPRLTYAQRQELEKLPHQIETLEKEQADLHDLLANPETYRSGSGTEVTTTRDRLTEIEETLTQAYTRWEELDQLAQPT
ncbi:MAG: ATP-binding cassette domain-containing protein [Lentisphaerae bacterium]|nr:ATP-binding cassette domain-containing protein [Lentisphaerota bacterium]